MNRCMKCVAPLEIRTQPVSEDLCDLCLIKIVTSALRRIESVPLRLIRNRAVACLDEILLEVKNALEQAKLVPYE
jgi:hypothetical protein